MQDVNRGEVAPWVVCGHREGHSKAWPAVRMQGRGLIATFLLRFLAAFDLPTDLGTPRLELIGEGGLQVRAIPTRHGDAPAAAYRVEYQGHALTFSGDIDPTGLPNLTVLAHDTDVLVFN